MDNIFYVLAMGIMSGIDMDKEMLEIATQYGAEYTAEQIRKWLVILN